jgi:hypothetical protein
LDLNHRYEAGHELQATLVELIDLSLMGKQLHWSIYGRPLRGFVRGAPGRARGSLLHSADR